MFCSDVYCLVVNKSKGSFDTRYSGKAPCAAKKMYKIIRGLEEKLNFRTTRTTNFACPGQFLHPCVMS